MHINDENWLQAQYSVLGSALIDPKVVPRVMSETNVDDFSGTCRTVYVAMTEIFNSGAPVDVISVAASLGESYKEFLVQLMEITPSAANVDYYITLCREQSRIWHCRDIGRKMAESECLKEIRILIEKTAKTLSSVSVNRRFTMNDSLKRFYDNAADPKKYISWPIPEMNNYLHVGPGKLIVLGAEPSVGKTALALQFAWHWSKFGKVGFFSFETDPETLFDRLVSGFVGIPMDRIKKNQITQKEWDEICQATSEISNRKLELISAAGMTVSDIRAKIIECGYKIVVVDYLQIVSARGGSRYEQVTNISIDLHTLAQSLGVIVLALAQLSRSDEDRQPRNSDLRESGQIEQDADIIIMLQLEKKSRPAGPRKLFVTKHKEGELFQMLLLFDGKHQIFSKGGALDSAVAAATEMKQMGKKRPRTYPPPQYPIPDQMELLPQNTKVPFNDN